MNDYVFYIVLGNSEAEFKIFPFKKYRKFDFVGNFFKCNILLKLPKEFSKFSTGKILKLTFEASSHDIKKNHHLFIEK